MFSILSLYIAGPREQMNQVTSVLDSSHIYGSTMEEAEKLRETNSSELQNSLETIMLWKMSLQSFVHDLQVISW